MRCCQKESDNAGRCANEPVAGYRAKGFLMVHLHRHTGEARRHTAEARRHTAEARRDTAEAPKAEHPVALIGRQFVRYALVVVIAWIGALKYSSYEAAAIHPLIANSPIMSWLYSIFSVRTFATLLGS